MTPSRIFLRTLTAGCVCLAACTQVTTRVSDGVVRTQGARSRLSGREEGEWTWWHASGEVAEQGSFDDGRAVGLWARWYPSGQIRARGERRWNAATKRSEREGVWVLWHPSGVEAARGTYRAGRREGRWEFTNEDGSLDGDRSGEYHDDVKLD